MERKSRKANIDYKTICKQWHESNHDQRKPTINDVARLAGVSKKTVSRVINNSESVNSGTREGIQAIIRGIGYFPDPQARGLAFRRSFLVGMIFDNPNPRYVVNIQLGILDVLRETGFELVVHPCDRSSEHFLQDVRRFIESQKLYGVILTPSVSEDEGLADVLREIGCAYVRIAAVALDRPEHMIVTNDRAGGQLAARHLAGSGHRRFAMVGGRAGFLSAKERRKGFEEGLSEYGFVLDEEYVLEGDYTFESGLRCGDAILEMDPQPTAVFAANDEMAAGVLQVMQRAGKDIPGAMSIVGFDDFDVATRMWPRLTTIHSPTRKSGELAARSLLEFSPERQVEPGENETKPHFVERESTQSV